ncbi:hypothetical protein B0H19DRAFT_147526 [Mycena capillaripes]|nr:hypothetical protein B0H19DRAFT_147526 [Mycena capillaripes]
MDIDAFFRAQDLRMNEPEDDMDEFLARMAKARNPPDLYHVSFDMLDDIPSANSVSEQSYREVTPNDSLQRQRNASLQRLSAKPKESTLRFLAPPGSERDMGESVEDKLMPPASLPTRTSPRRHAPTMKRISTPPSIPHASPDSNPPILKRKESPNKPDKPARKKPVMDPSILPSSPIEASP